MTLTKPQIIILTFLGIVACFILFLTSGLAYWLIFLGRSEQTTSVTQTEIEPPVVATESKIFSSDEEIASCIMQSFESSSFGTHADLVLDLMVSVNKEFVSNLRNPRRQVRTEDPNKEIWIIEAMYDYDSVDSGGRSTQTEVWQEALFDLTTGELIVSPESRRSFMAGGGKPSDLSLRISSLCPDISLP